MMRVSRAGSQLGPCLTPCVHADCRQMRQDACARCAVCGRPIGFERDYGRRRWGLVHADCDRNGAPPKADLDRPAAPLDPPEPLLKTDEALAAAYGFPRLRIVRPPAEPVDCGRGGDGQQ